MTTRRRIAGVGALVAMLAGSGCDYWTTVTVPAADPTPPIAAARIVEIGGGGFDTISFGAMAPASIVTNDPNRTFVAIGAAWDPQGARAVTVDREVVTACASGDLGAVRYSLLVPLDAEQPGTVGQDVDTGVWTGDYVVADDWDTCPAGLQPQSVEYTWWVTAENFAGAEAHHAIAKVRYEL